MRRWFPGRPGAAPCSAARESDLLALHGHPHPRYRNLHPSPGEVNHWFEPVHLPGGRSPRPLSRSSARPKASNCRRQFRLHPRGPPARTRKPAVSQDQARRLRACARRTSVSGQRQQRSQVLLGRRALEFRVAPRVVHRQADCLIRSPTTPADADGPESRAHRPGAAVRVPSVAATKFADAALTQLQTAWGQVLVAVEWYSSTLCVVPAARAGPP